MHNPYKSKYGNTDLSVIEAYTDTTPSKQVRLDNEAFQQIAIEAFLADQQVMQGSRKTYGWGVKRFFRWCNETGRNTAALYRADIISYIQYLSQSGYSPKTISSYTVAIRLFYQWLCSRGGYEDITAGVKPKRHTDKQGFVRMHLDLKEREMLLASAYRHGPRDYAIVNLMLRNGLRTIEVSRLDVCDITTRKGVRVLRLWRKGSLSKDSYVALTDEAYRPIESYLETRANTLDNSPLFTTDGDGHRGDRMTTRRIQQIVRVCLDEIGLDSHEYSPHSLRHTTAVAILESGGSIFDIQTVLGHASPETSEIYVKSAQEEIRLKTPPEALIRNAFGDIPENDPPSSTTTETE